MAPMVYISHMAQDSDFAATIRAALREYRFTTNVNSTEISIALLVLTYPYFYDARAEDARVLMGRPGVWCIPLFYQIFPHDLSSMARTPQAKPFWKELKDLYGLGFDRRDQQQYADKVAKAVRRGPYGSRPYDVFLSHAGEVKPFCHKLKTHLECHQLTCFLDQDSIRGGPGAVPFSDEIHDAIKSSKLLLVVISHHFASKRWPVEEIAVCKGSQVKALPVYYQISRAQCLETLGHARSPGERAALAWLHQQPGIEHFGLHAGEQPTEEQLIQNVVQSVLQRL